MVKISALSISTSVALCAPVSASADPISDGVKSVGNAVGDVIKNTAGPIVENIVPLRKDSPIFGLVSGGTTLVERIGADTITTVSGKGVLGQELSKLSGDVFSTVQKANNDITSTVEKAGSDTIASYRKGLRDIDKQAQASFEDSIDAGRAIVRYEQRMLQDQISGFGRAASRARDGKIVDAVWGLGVEPLQAQERNFFLATQESSIINQAAASAAATYGGPGGAAAYASWQAYKTTGDASYALKVGIIAGVQSQLGPSEPLDAATPLGEALKKAALAGAAGGLAVAAQGGDEASIKDAFLRSSGTVIIQAGKDKLQAYSPKNYEYAQLIGCISAKNVDCLSNSTYVKDAKGKLISDLKGELQVETSAIDASEQIGKWTGVDLKDNQNKVEKIVADVSKLQDGKSIALFGGNWVMTTTLGSVPSIPYGKPHVVLTAVGQSSPFNFSREIKGKVSNQEIAATSATKSGNYSCRIGNESRRISTTTEATSCVSIYYRADGSSQVIWRTPSKPNVCAEKARQFVKDMSLQGMKCTAK